MSYKEEFIAFLVESGALKFGDFVTKSGRKSPFFINTGCFTTGEQLTRLAGFYAQTVHETFGTDLDILFGPAYKGIPLATACTMQLYDRYGMQVRYMANRKEVKDHGDTGILLGGPVKDGDRIVIIEDVTTAGTSIRETLPILKACADAKVLGLVVAVDRMERGTGEKSALVQIAEEYGMKTTAIVTMQEVVDCLTKPDASGKAVIDDAMLAKIKAYYEAYGAV